MQVKCSSKLSRNKNIQNQVIIFKKNIELYLGVSIYNHYRVFIFNKS